MAMNTLFLKKGGGKFLNQLSIMPQKLSPLADFKIGHGEVSLKNQGLENERRNHNQTRKLGQVQRGK